jgi:hypothetical protein
LPSQADPSQVNVALVLPGGTDGHCFGGDPNDPSTGTCYVPLDNDATEGFVIDGQTIRLPEQACKRAHVVGVAVTQTCRTKDLSIPICGPWTGWPSSADGTGGASNASAGDGGEGGAGKGIGGGSTATAGAGGQSSIGPQAHASKLDVLFVLDNSVGMADKHAVLSASVPAFLSGLAKSVQDIHFGVITTSLGGHGGQICADSASPHQDDQGELLAAKRTGVPTYTGTDFLSYDAAGKTGVADAAAVASDLQKTIAAVGQDGCGYEAPLEAMYRFLIDPEPPISVQLQGGQSVVTGTNAVVLAERQAFLRPDSAVAIVILTDENDCSVRDDGVGWFVTSATARMPRATSACDANPNDSCCRSCAQNEATPPMGCSTLAQDPVCASVPSGQPYATWDALHDSLNLRCFDQQQRFGFDLLYPVERYTNGLSNPKVPNRAGALVDNPLLVGGRSATLISVSTIIGAPWQDLGNTDSLTTGHALTYLDGAALNTNQRWPVLLGDPTKNTPPTDPFMIESIDPRTGENPLSHDKVGVASSQDPTLSAINGHEYNVPNRDDLQYACIYALPAARACSNGDAACACSATLAGDTTPVVSGNSPICQPPTGGPASTTQYYAKAYPGARELRLAQLLAERAVPASICPKTFADAASPDYAYTPGLNALITRITSTLN